MNAVWGSLQKLSHSFNFVKLLIGVCGIFFLIVLGASIPLLGFRDYSTLVYLIVIISMLLFFVWVAYKSLLGRPVGFFSVLIISTIIVDATFRSREYSNQSIDGQTLIKLMIWSFCLLVALVQTPNLIQKLFAPRIRWLSIFSIYALIGSLYSLTPTYTFGAAFAAIAYCGLAVCVVENLEPRKILIGLLYGCSALLVLSLLMYLAGMGMVVQENGAVLRLGGVVGSANSLGRTASLTLLLVAALVLSKEIKLISWPVLLTVGLAFACLQLSDSRTSLGAFAFAVMCFYMRKYPKLLFLSVISFSLLILFYINSDLTPEALLRVFSRSGRISEVMTLTGRTDIWSASWDAIKLKPIFGYGFGSSKILLPAIYRTYWGFTVTHAHNMYIQTLLVTGALGFLFLLAAMATLILKSIRTFSVFPFLFAFFMLVYGLTEPGPMGTATNLMTFFFALALAWPHSTPDTSDPQ